MKKNYLLFLALLSLIIINSNVFAQSSSIKMNEIYSRGVTADPDWIEIYNSSSAPIDISGYKIYDAGGQGGTKPKLEFPANTIIPAKGFFALVTDISTSTNPAGFGLSSGGEKVWLEDKSGNLIDTVTFTAMETTQSYGRLPDGGSWGLLKKITKGYSNSLVLMNEIYSRGITSDPDWIEIYNASDTIVDISGYKIYDAGGQGGTKPKLEFPANTKIPAKGFFAMVTDISTSTNPAGFGLSSGGEKVWLEDKSGSIIDSVTFAAMAENQSFGRYSDGFNWRLLSTLTKGATNNTVNSVKTNERFDADYKLYQNYPNPFNPSTVISYNLKKDGFVNISIYNSLGQEVKTLVNKKLNAGSYSIVWDAAENSGSRISSGTYYYNIKVDNKLIESKSMLFVK